MKAPPINLLNVLVAYLTAVRFPATYNGTACAFSGQLMFETVKVFDMADFAVAIEEMLLVKKRVAIIVPMEERQAASISGLNMIVTFRNDYAILMSDRSYKNRQLALVGDTTTPGCLLMSDVLVQGMTGEIASGFVCEPGGGDVFAFSGENRDNETGRIGWRQDVTMHGGRIERQLSRAALQLLVKT